MDRPQSPVKASHPSSAKSSPAIDLRAAIFSPATPDSTHALFAPLHYESGYAYPLIVWLHGARNDERQLMRIMPMISMRNYVAVAPRGVFLEEGEKPSYGWSQSEKNIEEAEQRIFDSIDTAIAKLHVAPRRIFLAGFDDGGTMAFRVAMNHPHRFAGVLSLCGSFPEGRRVLGNLGEVRRVPILLAVGRDSEPYPSDKVCENLKLLHTAGLSVTLRQYPCGHELSPQMLGDVDRWIIEQITTTDTTPSQREQVWLDED